MNERLYTSTEVAILMRMTSKTIIRWAADGQIDSMRTPGGHYRFTQATVDALLSGGYGRPMAQPQRKRARD